MIKIRLIVILGMIFLMTGFAHGQVNTEKLRQGLDEDGFSIGAEFTYSLTKGNSEIAADGLDIIAG